MLEMHGVVAGYGPVVVLRGVDFVAPPGAVVALFGPNGAGKTTLLRVASGLLRPSAGRVGFDGADIVGRPPHLVARLGVCHVPEGRSVFPGLTVRDNLHLYARSGEETEAVERAVEAFPILGSRMDQQAGTLSGGQQQMLALARAYVTRPRLALLDEVSMGLAPVVVDEIFEFIRRLAETGSSLVLVEQYVSRALEIADFVFVLDRGQIVFSGEAGQVSGEDLAARYLASSG